MHTIILAFCVQKACRSPFFPPRQIYSSYFICSCHEEWKRDLWPPKIAKILSYISLYFQTGIITHFKKTTTAMLHSNPSNYVCEPYCPNIHPSPSQRTPLQVGPSVKEQGCEDPLRNSPQPMGFMELISTNSTRYSKQLRFAEWVAECSTSRHWFKSSALGESTTPFGMHQFVPGGE